MKRFLIITCSLMVFVTSIVWAQQKARIDGLETQARNLAQKRQKLLEKHIELLKQQLALLKRQAPGSKAVLAMQSILDLKLSQERVRSTLSGASIVAADGTYLGRLGPTYDTESIFCSYGTYGATYSTESIWCTFGDYGASYSDLSPFCSYSTEPPKIIVDGTVVASLTVGWLGFPLSISPHTLKAIFAEE